MYKAFYLLFITIFFNSLTAQNAEYTLKKGELKKYSITEGIKNPNIVYSLEVSTYNDPFLKRNIKNKQKLKSHLSKISEFKNLRRLVIYTDIIDLEFLLTYLAGNSKVEDLHLMRATNVDWSSFFLFLNNYENLKHLKISQSSDLIITNDIYKNKNLSSFSLVDVDISRFSEDFFNLDFLDTFSIDGTNLKSLPDDLKRLKSLRKVEIIDQPSFNFSKSFKILSQIDTLKYLSLLSNEMKILPDEIGLIESLEELYLSNNDLANLPKSLVNLKKLKRINCSRGNPNLQVSDTFIESFHLVRLKNGNFNLRTTE